MGKQSKRPVRAQRDFHAAIRAAAETLRTEPGAGMRQADDEFPEVAELLHAARDAVAAGAPRFVFFRGRNYWLRIKLAAAIDVFADPGDRTPLFSGLSLSTEPEGHRPGH